MKAITHILLTGIALSIITWACSKDQTAPVDFRDPYIGQYQVKENIFPYGSCHPNDPVPTKKDTVIEIGYGETDTTLSVLGRDIWLDSMNLHHRYHYSLYLTPDSIYSTFLNGGLGCGFTEKHYGRKIK